MMIDGPKIVQQLQTMRDGGYLADAIMREAVKQLKAAEPRYNFVGVYMLNPNENMLWLHNYSGEPTDHVRIEVGVGVCGTAVAEKANQNVADVTKVENYLSCSPRTKSELVVLLRSGEDIFGQIDIDAKEINAFAPEDQKAIEMIGEKISEIIVRERAEEDELRRLQELHRQRQQQQHQQQKHEQKEQQLLAQQEQQQQS
jgi:putative methionine-R-sulfoxide reductase with GAF domain